MVMREREGGRERERDRMGGIKKRERTARKGERGIS